ncbi:uncharacterized protein LOC126320766 [Schistocerca gregaria]|uniref:uncharacterized protein LOC126320766 n=1 Tax=Schistocerca gregaria TaxID=7010 RepID=UPI00211DE534|nr:uncharacterized protein LOC126320766 [Schistocerca gregaria]
MGNSNVHSRILVLGIDGAGKTSFLERYEYGTVQDILVKPTEAYVIKDIKVKGMKLHVWDVSGKEATRSLWKHYYSSEDSTDAIIWVIDGSSSEERIEESRAAFNIAMSDPALNGILLYVLVNKNDLPECRSTEVISDTLNLNAQRDRRAVFISSISAKTGANVREAMEELAKGVKAAYKNKNI